MRLGRSTSASVNGKNVLRTCGEGDDGVHLRAEHDVVPRLRHGLLEGERAILRPRDVHEKVQRGGEPGRLQAQFKETAVQVVGAVVVVLLDAKKLVASGVARREHRVSAPAQPPNAPK